MNEIKKKETRGAALLTLTSILWGVAFIFQRTGMDHIGPFAFNFFMFIKYIISIIGQWIF